MTSFKAVARTKGTSCKGFFRNNNYCQEVQRNNNASGEECRNYQQQTNPSRIDAKHLGQAAT
ncbi:hypothetical protein D3C71_2049670 [compost metagenome]